MDCPKCKNITLKPTKLEQGLLAMSCPQCQGALISLLYYRDWAERHHNEAQGVVENTQLVEAEDTHNAMACPKCKKLMLKFRISGQSDNKLDLCSSCDEAWLDGGEWDLLKFLHLSDKIPLIFTEQWQYQLRQQLAEAQREQRLQKLVGAQDLDKAKQARQWLKDHPYRNDIIFFINHE